MLEAQPRARDSINGSPAQIVEGPETVDRGVACLCALVASACFCLYAE